MIFPERILSWKPNLLVLEVKLGYRLNRESTAEGRGCAVIKSLQFYLKKTGLKDSLLKTGSFTYPFILTDQEV